MSFDLPHQWAGFIPFDPRQGSIIRRPTAPGAGYWMGAPSLAYDDVERCHYLVYRVRRPRGVAPDRGAEIRIARSTDGVDFTDICLEPKDQLNTTTIERCALARRHDGGWRLYVSYVDPADARWRIDRVEADRVETLELPHALPVLTAADTGCEGVKDPFLFEVAGLWHMIVSFATADGDAKATEMHATHDAYNTGLIRSRSGLATSHDGVRWEWEGEILGPSRDGWDKYCARIGCVWRHDGLWLGLYDGSADVSQNYEEQCGLAYSHDLRRWVRVSRGEPLMTPHGGVGALRYFDVVDTREATLFYYEMALEDGSHDLRVYRREKEPWATTVADEEDKD